MTLHWGFMPLERASRERGLFSTQDALKFAAAGPRRRQEMLGSRVMMRDLAFLAGLPVWRGLEAGRDGQPRLVGAHDLWVSLSHAGDWALGAISDQGPVGVDLEPIGTVFDQPAFLRRMCSPEEHASLQNVSPPRRRQIAARLWTAKEALLKADGRGLSADPRHVTSLSNRVIRPTMTPRGYAAAVAVLPVAGHEEEARGP